jgi:hypothetical protein
MLSGLAMAMLNLPRACFFKDEARIFTWRSLRANLHKLALHGRTFMLALAAPAVNTVLFLPSQGISTCMAV